MSEELTLGLAMMVKNEAPRIVRSMASTLPIISHLAILDTGSTDGTQEVIRKFAEEHSLPLLLHEEPFVDFATSRNVLLSKLQDLPCDYFVILDSNDELRHPEILKTHLERIQEEPDASRITHFMCASRIENDGSSQNTTILARPCCIKRDPSLFYQFPIHEVLSSSREDFLADTTLTQTNLCLFQDRTKDKDSLPRIKGSDIPLAGRITAIADVFDALTSKRPYKPAFPLQKSLDIIKQGRGSHFDPEVVDAFFAAKGEILATREKYKDKHESLLVQMVK